MGACLISCKLLVDTLGRFCIYRGCWEWGSSCSRSGSVLGPIWLGVSCWFTHWVGSVCDADVRCGDRLVCGIDWVLALGLIVRRTRTGDDLFMLVAVALFEHKGGDALVGVTLRPLAADRGVG